MAIRVANKFKVTQILQTSKGGKKVTFTPVFTIADPEFTTGIALYDNGERSIEVYVPSNSSSINTFAVDDYYYMDFTAA